MLFGELSTAYCEVYGIYKHSVRVKRRKFSANESVTYSYQSVSQE
jgi:hypothetical protein